MTEQWRPVAGYDGLYSVSDLGRVRREVAITNTYPGKILKQQLPRNGYLQVCLCKNGIPRRFSVHRLVAVGFLGYPPLGYHANHRNGIKTDNSADNLEWISPSGNQKHAFSSGLAKSPACSSEQNGNAKLTFNQAEAIRSRYLAGNITQKELAEEYNVSRPVIGKIVTGRSYFRPPV